MVIAHKDTSGKWQLNHPGKKSQNEKLQSDSSITTDLFLVDEDPTPNALVTIENKVEAAVGQGDAIGKGGSTEVKTIMEVESDEISPGSSAVDSRKHDGELCMHSNSNHNYSYNDPVVFCGRRLKTHDINTCLSSGPCQPSNYTFPTTNGRSFNNEWFGKELPDKTIYTRKWLTYSVSVDKVFCIPCMLFSGPAGSDIWTTVGYQSWHNGSRDVQRHETSAEHRTAEIAQITWQRGIRIDSTMSRNINILVEENRRVVDCAIDCVRFLATEMIAFRGKSSTEGKFLGMFRTMAKRDSSAAAYLMKIDNANMTHKKMPVNLISPGNIRIMLMTMKRMIVEKIVDRIKLQKKACIIFDSTQDYSKREASVLLVRYLEEDCTGNGKMYPHERLVEVFTTGETTGEVMKHEVMEVFKKIKFDTDWLIGQCYDGAGNMRGRYKGLATLVQEVCSKAIYIWCHAHRLNLVMNKVMSCCADVRNALGILEELHTFLNGHRRNDVFMKAQSKTQHKMQTKRVSTTRWNSTEAAVETVLCRYAEILVALQELAVSPKSDSETVTAAVGLQKRLKDMRVIMSMEILKVVYHNIGPASRLLQGATIDLAAAAAVLQDCKKEFRRLRQNADSEWQRICAESTKFASKHGVKTEFPEQRQQQIKRVHGDKVPDESLSGPMRVKVETFITVLDEVSQQIESRFETRILCSCNSCHYSHRIVYWILTCSKYRAVTSEKYVKGSSWMLMRLLVN